MLANFRVDISGIGVGDFIKEANRFLESIHIPIMTEYFPPVGKTEFYTAVKSLTNPFPMYTPFWVMEQIISGETSEFVRRNKHIFEKDFKLLTEALKKAGIKETLHEEKEPLENIETRIREIHGLKIYDENDVKVRIAFRVRMDEKMCTISVGAYQPSSREYVTLEVVDFEKIQRILEKHVEECKNMQQLIDSATKRLKEINDTIGAPEKIHYNFLKNEEVLPFYIVELLNSIDLEEAVDNIKDWLEFKKLYVGVNKAASALLWKVRSVNIIDRTAASPTYAYPPSVRKMPFVFKPDVTLEGGGIKYRVMLETTTKGTLRELAKKVKKHGLEAYIKSIAEEALSPNIELEIP